MFINRAWVLPPITVLCILGAYATSNSFFSVWVMFAFGSLGYFLDRWGIPLGPFVIGFVLAPIAETKLRSGLGIHRGDITPLFTSPLSLAFLILSAVLLFWPLFKPLWGKLNGKLGKTASTS